MTAAPEPRTETYFDGPLGKVVEVWNRFWFRPAPATTLGLIRIAYGALVFFWTLSFIPYLLDFFGPTSLQPDQPSARYSWSLIALFGDSDTAVVVLWAVLLVAAAALTVGWHSRIAALLVFLLVLSFQRREPYIFNSGDGMLRIEALLLALAPTGAALSLDRRRTAGSFRSAQVRAPWVVRLLQVQLSVVYLATVHDKLTGTTWNNGTAVSYSLRLTDLGNLHAPMAIIMNPFLMNVAAWSTLLLELSLGVLVWFRRTRAPILWLGVVLHLMILLTLAVGFFSFAVFILYLAFVPPAAAERFTSRFRRTPTESPQVEAPVEETVP